MGPPALSLTRYLFEFSPYSLFLIIYVYYGWVHRKPNVRAQEIQLVRVIIWRKRTEKGQERATAGLEQICVPSRARRSCEPRVAALSRVGGRFPKRKSGGSAAPPVSESRTASASFTHERAHSPLYVVFIDLCLLLAYRKVDMSSSASQLSGRQRTCTGFRVAYRQLAARSWRTINTGPYSDLHPRIL